MASVSPDDAPSPIEPGAPDPATDDGAPGATQDWQDRPPTPIFDELVAMFTLLTRIDERLTKIEAFCNDVQTAVNSMPAFPFMPKFPKVGASNGGK